MASPFAFGALDVDPETGEVPMGPAKPGPVEKVARGLARGVGELVALPGRAMQDGITTEQAVDWAAPLAMGMMGMGRMPGGVPAGAVGSGGSKLVQPEGIRAFHGSPHDFDAFDLSKIGTGEGAQSYGHGLYFAQKEGVARSYRDALAADPRDKLTEMVQGWTGYRQPGEQVTADMVRNGLRNSTAPGLNKVAASDDVVRDVVTYINGHSDDLKTISPEAMRALKRIDATLPTPSGKMYEVNINAKPEQFLDWDKPLYQQGPQAADAFKNITKMELGPPIVETGAPNAGQFIKSMGRMVGDEKISRQLNEVGIPGIRYLDQGSRGLGANPAGSISMFEKALQKHPGDEMLMRQLADAKAAQAAEEARASRNYVVFNPKIVDIVRKYAIPGAIGAGGFGSLAPGDDRQ